MAGNARVGIDATPEQIELALREGRYDQVLAFADAAIQELLHEGVSVEDFVRLSLRGAALESLLRAERSAVMRFRHLHEPIALRWEVLRRSGRIAEARQMRQLCIRHFPERASVWATAGNQALDEQQYDQAEACFERCLRCNSRWTAGLAGMAIVWECRKDWARALDYRRQVVEVEDSLAKRDPPSLQRSIRYAAALARVERWEEAGSVLRRCVERGAYQALPAERSLLMRVFSRELYAPAIIAALCESDPDATRTPEVEFALSEAESLARLARFGVAEAAFDATARLKWLGLTAWLAGDYAGAYELLDEAEVDASEDLAIQCFLAWSALSIGADDRESVCQFALERARATLAVAGAQHDADAACASIIFARVGDQRGALDGWPATFVDACAEPVSARLLRLAMFRAAQRSVGRSALEVAQASTDALRALALDLTRLP